MAALNITSLCEKRWAYDERVRDLLFTFDVSASGGMRPTATRKLASMLAALITANTYSDCVADFVFHF